MKQPQQIGLPTSKTGNYAVTTVKTMPWLSRRTEIGKKDDVKGSKPGAPTRAKKSRPAPKIVHTIFNECAALTTDAFWQTTLKQCSQGKFPRNFLFKENCLTYKRGTKTQRIEIPDNAVDALTISVDFFRNMAGIRSQNDKEREQRQLEEKLLELGSLEDYSWSELTHKIQDLLISAFVETVSNSLEPKLTFAQQNQLTTIINLGFLLGYFTSTSVNYVDGHILGIKGLVYDANKKEFILDFSQTSVPKIAKSKSKIIPAEEYLNPKTRANFDRRASVSFLSHWISFINSLSNSSKPPSTPASTEPATPSLRVVSSSSDHLFDDTLESTQNTVFTTTDE